MNVWAGIHLVFTTTEPTNRLSPPAETDTVVLNGRGARFNQGEPIAMGIDDVAAVREVAAAAVAAVHMEAINHSLLSRAELRSETEGVLVPADGEWVDLYLCRRFTLTFCRRSGCENRTRVSASTRLKDSPLP